MSLIVLFGTWLSCIKLKFETEGFVKGIEIDGGAMMNSLIVTYMRVQMGFPRVYGQKGSGTVNKRLTNCEQIFEKSRMASNENS